MRQGSSRRPLKFMPKTVFLLAHPAGHSLSPAMHNAAFEQLGLAAHYEALDVPPDAVEEAVGSLRNADCYGANVTVPHKLAVIPFMDELTEAAEAVGAVNTIVNTDGKLLGNNTDASGFLRALRGGLDESLVEKTAVMLGAGGAARAVTYALLSENVRVRVYNRTVEKAQALAEDFEALGDISVLDEGGLEPAVQTADLLVNTTSVGMARGGVDPETSPLPSDVLPSEGFVCDLVYRPAKTKLLRDAEAAGLLVQNGLPMLVYQGAEAFERWTGREAPVEVMFQALSETLEAEALE